MQRAREVPLFAGFSSRFRVTGCERLADKAPEAPMQQSLVTQPARPSRAQIEPAALALLSRHSAGLLATARRYSATPEDAEDAYQRGVEILLTKAPTTTEDELLPWLKTVIKHESFAVRKSTGRALPADEPLEGEATGPAWTVERAERYERLRLGAEAMAGLKPQEVRCLLLKAEGLSYQEICEVTNFSYTKVNRCITEGRRAFMRRVANIESGAECQRLAPLISKAADGEASAAEMRQVRPHLKGCLACKATLREYRATPARLAGLVPPVVAITGGGGGTAGFLGRIAQALQERFGGLGDAAGAKAAAVAASAVVIAGGGAAGIDALHHDPPTVAPSAYASAADAQAAKTAAPAAGRSAADPSASGAPDPSIAAIVAVDATSSPGPAGAEQATKPATSAPEFDPGAAGEAGSGSAADPRPAEFASAPSALSPSPDAVSGTPRAGSGTASAGAGTASGGSGTARGEFGP
jgi:DNA-directed RNA polymerase specialized sigma24 family protein